LESKTTKRTSELELLKREKYTMVFYEAPHRIIETLGDMLKVFGNRPISISREISKKYEEVYRGKTEEVMREIGEPKGEFVIVVEGNKEEIKYENLSIKEHLKVYMDDGYGEKEAMKLVANDRGISKNEIYKEVKLFPGK
jgi:16S rRNA (cytidine1402-2'-O)-methyltransferase